MQQKFQDVASVQASGFWITEVVSQDINQESRGGWAQPVTLNECGDAIWYPIRLEQCGSNALLIFYYPRRK